MSLSSLYTIAQRSLLAYQAAANATGQNIANAETPGYTRQKIGLRTDPVARGGIAIPDLRSGSGSGVGIGDMERVRNAVLDAGARRAQTGSEGAGLGYQLLSALERQLAPDGGDALYGAFNAFWGAWTDVADQPTDLGVRNAVLASGEYLAQTLQAADGRLEAFEAAVAHDLTGTVEGANTLLTEIAGLNVAVQSAHARGATDAAAEDRRDTLLDELAGYLPVQTRAETDGTVTVSFGGMAAVQGATALPLTVTGPPHTPAYEVRAAGSSRPIPLSGTEGGTIGAHLYALTTALPGARQSLDALAAGLVEQVNAVHAGGVGLDGVTGRSFFDPAGTTAATLTLSADLAGPHAVAASAAAGEVGDGSVAGALSAVGDAFDGLVTRMLTTVGASVRNAESAATANAAYADHALALRDGVSKVSLDEELTQLIKFQQAYAASARVLETAQGLFDTLIAL